MCMKGWSINGFLKSTNRYIVYIASKYVTNNNNCNKILILIILYNINKLTNHGIHKHTSAY